MKPSEKSLYKLKHLFNLLGVRIIPAYFLTENKTMFENWHYNACNQTALIVGYVLHQLLSSAGLNNSNPFYNSKFVIDLYEGLFTEGDLTRHYNHAYVYAYQTQDGEITLSAEDAYCFFIDVARISNPTVFQAGVGLSPSPEAYSTNYQLQGFRQLEFDQMLYSQHEYYTGKLGIDICKDVEKKLLQLGFDLTLFDWQS